MLNHHGVHLTTRLRKYQTEIFGKERKSSKASELGAPGGRCVATA